MITYEPLRQLLSFRNIKISDLISEGGFSTATTAKINKDEPIQFDTLERLCSLLDVPIEEIIVFVDESGNKKTNKDNVYEDLKAEIIALREKITEQEKDYQEVLSKIDATKHRKEEREHRETIINKKYTILDLKGIRKSQRLKQYQVAEKMGITGSYLGMFERQDQYLSKEQLDLIKEILPIPEENIVEVE